jgi:hypothetical protein
MKQNLTVLAIFLGSVFANDDTAPNATIAEMQ